LGGAGGGGWAAARLGGNIESDRANKKGCEFIGRGLP